MSALGTFFASFTGGLSSAWKRNIFTATLLFALFLYPFGLVFVGAGLLPGEFDWSASIIISLYALLVFLSEHRSGISLLSLLKMGALLGLVYCIEYVGVKTGFPFGSYQYTHVLGFQIGGVPAAIVLAWYTTVVSSRSIAVTAIPSHLSGRRVAVALVAGLLTVALDLALEPMAAFIKNYWIWTGESVPFQNYISWFLISSSIVFVLEGGSAKEHSPSGADYRIAVLVFMMQLSLFVVTGMSRGFIVAPLVATGLTLMVFMGRRMGMSLFSERRLVRE